MYDIFCEGKNIFLTGGAGVGKTTLANKMILPELARRGYNFAVTASTGIAASHLAGRTLHSWAGIGLGPKWGYNMDSRDYNVPSEGTLRSLAKKNGLDSTQSTAMLAHELAEVMGEDELHKAAVHEVFVRTYDEWTSRGNKAMLDGIRKRIRNTEVLLLDEVSMMPGESLLDYIDFFFKRVRGNKKPFGGIQMIFVGDFLQLPPVSKSRCKDLDWAFKCKSWKEADVVKHELTKVYRQDNIEFIDLLNSVRRGNPLTLAQKEYLQRFVVEATDEEMLKEITFIVPTNAQAKAINTYVLGLYEGEMIKIRANYVIGKHHTRFVSYDKIADQLNKATILHDELEIKEGCKVLLTVNASMSEDDSVPRYVNGTKCTVDYVAYDDNDDVEYVYVTIDEEVKAYEEGQTDKKPENIRLERYAITRGNHEPSDEMIYDSEGNNVPKYPQMRQFPIIPASAITAHKSQGTTLSSAAIDLDSAFAAGQVYVALSRLSSPEGLILNSVNMPVFADKEALEYYEQ